MQCLHSANNSTTLTFKPFPFKFVDFCEYEFKIFAQNIPLGHVREIIVLPRSLGWIKGRLLQKEGMEV